MFIVIVFYANQLAYIVLLKSIESSHLVVFPVSLHPVLILHCHWLGEIPEALLCGQVYLFIDVVVQNKREDWILHEIIEGTSTKLVELSQVLKVGHLAEPPSLSERKDTVYFDQVWQVHGLDLLEDGLTLLEKNKEQVVQELRISRKGVQKCYSHSKILNIKLPPSKLLKCLNFGLCASYNLSYTNFMH